LISLALHRPVAAMTYAYRRRASPVSEIAYGHSRARVLVWNSATALRDACISDLRLPASRWRFFLLNPVFRVIDRPGRVSSRCWLRKSDVSCKGVSAKSKCKRRLYYWSFSLHFCNHLRKDRLTKIFRFRSGLRAVANFAAWTFRLPCDSLILIFNTYHIYSLSYYNTFTFCVSFISHYYILFF